MVHLGADAFAELRGEGAFSDGDDASFESAAAAAAREELRVGGGGGGGERRAARRRGLAVAAPGGFD